MPDTEHPTAPGNLSGERSRTAARCDLTWEAASDNVAVTGYEVYRDDQLIDDDRPGHLLLRRGGRRATYAYHLRALDPAGNASDAEQHGDVTVLPLDTEKPEPPGEPHARPAGAGAGRPRHGTRRRTTGR